MTYGTSIFLLAVGAILAFAVNKTVSGIDIQTVGWILMAVGVLGLVLSFLYAQRFRRREVYAVRERPVVEERPVVTERPVGRDREYL